MRVIGHGEGYAGRVNLPTIPAGNDASFPGGIVVRLGRVGYPGTGCRGNI